MFLQFVIKKINLKYIIYLITKVGLHKSPTEKKGWRNIKHKKHIYIVFVKLDWPKDPLLGYSLRKQMRHMLA